MIDNSCEDENSIFYLLCFAAVGEIAMVTLVRKSLNSLFRTTTEKRNGT